MKFITSATIVYGVTTIASGQSVMMDQIGPMDGTGVGTAITGCQDFEAAYDVYDIVTADNFTGAGETISTLEMVLNGWNGFVDPSSVTSYSANLYTSEAALALSLVGDITSEFIDLGNVTLSPDWLGSGFLISANTTMVSNIGTQLVSLIPSNRFATGGQTGIVDSLIGDGVFSWQGNPGGGFGMPGNLQQTTSDSAYRLTSNTPADPCNLPLPTLCTADVDGDFVVAVGDVLLIIGSWGECGDGTFRPIGDIAPLPYGDCCVDVADILAVIGSWGDDCTPTGACCSDTGVCTDNLTQGACLALGGFYMSDGSLCADNECVSGACCINLLTCNDAVGMWQCEALGGVFRGQGSICASLSCDTGCNAMGCQLPDQLGHGAGGIIGATSDLNVNAGFQVADTFKPTISGSITEVCWWGLYIDFSTNTDCGVTGPGTGDNFTITYYLDDVDSTIPGTSFAGPFPVSASATATGNVIPSGIGDLVQYTYTAIHPPVSVVQDGCYWISIVNQTTGTCFWLWETAPAGDERSAQDNAGWGARDYDLAFCVNVDTALDACVAFVGPCCLPDLTCQLISAGSCAAIAGVYGGDNLTCADVNNCQPIPGACCMADGSCVDGLFDADCFAFGGNFMGESTICVNVNCIPDPYDQIGASDGSGVGVGTTASQIFEPASAAYDIATLDNFSFTASTHISAIEAVINGWNGFIDITPVTNYTISVYSSPTAAGTSLVGDIYSIDIVAPTLPPWTGAGYLVSFPIDVTLPVGEYYFAVIPWNNFGTNGQTGIVDYTDALVGDGNYWQANPNGGFGFGPWQLGVGDSAYRLTTP